MSGGKPPRGALASDRTVLIVDDDEEYIAVVEVLLRREGFKTLTAGSGAQAMHLLAKQPAAVVLDLVMPGAADGFAVLEAVERLPYTTPVVVVTGYPSPSDRARAEKSSCVKAVLGKPLRQNELVEVLHESLGTAPDPPGPGGP